MHRDLAESGQARRTRKRRMSMIPKMQFHALALGLEFQRGSCVGATLSEG